MLLLHTRETCLHLQMSQTAAVQALLQGEVFAQSLGLSRVARLPASSLAPAESVSH